MKNNALKLFSGFVLLIFCNNLLYSQSYLHRVLDKLDKIETATYLQISETWGHTDTIPSNSFSRIVKEYKNLSDTTIGASFVSIDADTKKTTLCYDGHMRASFYNEEKEIVIDDFTVRKLPFRPVSSPFFNYTTSIIRYILTTNDSIKVEMQERESDTYVHLTINEDRQVEFFGKAFHMPKSPLKYDNTSVYELWIDKKTDLPYKIRREMSHNISVKICLNPQFNTLNIKDFKAADYFPADYTIKPYRFETTHKTHSLLNQKAPYWELQTGDNNNTITLTDFHSKVFMMQFTSVHCGPCLLSIPFLKKLYTKYPPSDFQFVAVECTSNSHTLDYYIKKHGINYRFVSSNKAIIKDYSIRSFPVFFIMDKDKIIRKVIYGYSEENAAKEISATIEALMK